MIKVLAFNYEDQNLPEKYAEVFESKTPMKVKTIESKLLGEMVIIKTRDNHRVVIYTGDIPTSELTLIEEYPRREQWHMITLDTYAEVEESTCKCNQVNWNVINRIVSKV